MINFKFLNNTRLRRACHVILEYEIDWEIDDLPDAQDLPDTTLTRLATICMQIDNEPAFLTESKDLDNILTHMQLSFNQQQIADRVELVDYLQEMLIDYYMDVIRDVFDDVARNMNLEKLDAALGDFCYE